MSVEPALSLDLVGAGYGQMTVVRDFSLTLESGHAAALLGRNGVGKTTLVRTIMGLLPAQSGSIQVFGRDTTREPAHVLAKLGVAYVPQEGGLFDELTVEENLRLVLPSGAELKTRTGDAFELFPFLADRVSQRAGSLSGGQRKMLMMARVMIQQPRLAILDEIAEGVQPSNVRHIEAALRHLMDNGAAALVVEQRLDFALAIATDFQVLKGGETVAQGAVTSSTAENVARHLVL